MDDILASHDDLKKLQATTKGVEDILEAGGFALQPWVFSGQGGRGDHFDRELLRQKTMQKDAFVSPNQMSDDNKALGLGYYCQGRQTPCHGGYQLLKEKEKNASWERLNA